MASPGNPHCANRHTSPPYKRRGQKIQISQYNLVIPDLGPAPVLVVETVVMVTERSVQHQSFFRSARHLAHYQATCRRIGARNYLAAYKWHSGVTVDNNTDNDNHDNVYGAVVMTEVIARVHPVDLMNVDWAPGGRQPSDQANWLGPWVCRKLAATVHIHHRHCYYYSAGKLILILPSHEGWKAESNWELQ